MLPRAKRLRAECHPIFVRAKCLMAKRLRAKCHPGQNVSGQNVTQPSKNHERNTRSSQAAAEAEDDLFQYFTTDGSEAEENGDAPPPYHIATGTIPCKHCRFTAKNRNDFVEHFQKRPDHWSCLACQRGFTTFKDFYRHIVRRRCNRSNGQNGIVTKMNISLLQ